MKKILSLILCLTLLTGCAAPGGTYTPTGDGLAPEEDTIPDPTPVTQQSIELAYYPDRLLNPYTCGDYTNRVLFGLVYQSLFAVNEDYEPRPVLCTGYQVSQDMKTYTFQIARATFSDGSSLTTADVVASLRAAVDSPYYQGRFDRVSSISADQGAVTVTLSTPYENFLVLLDVPIVKASQVTDQRPLGTGPYYYDTDREALCLRRRTDWWCAAQIPVSAGKIGLVEAESPSQIRDRFEFEDLTMVCADPGSDTYVDFHKDHELWAAENGLFLYLGINRYSQSLSGGTVLSALTYAIPRDQIVEDHFRGFAESAVLPASPRSPYYDQRLAATVTYDPQRLTDAVAGAGLTGSAVTLLVSKDSGLRVQVARTVAQSLEACGLQVTVDARSGEDYTTALEQGGFDLYLGQTRLSATMDLSAFFAPEGALSFGRLSDPVIYALCQEALANRGNYYTLYQRVLEEGLLCPIAFRSYAVYAQRGAFTQLTPARDFLFYYDLGLSAQQILLEGEE